MLGNHISENLQVLHLLLLRDTISQQSPRESSFYKISASFFILSLRCERSKNMHTNDITWTPQVICGTLSANTYISAITTDEQKAMNLKNWVSHMGGFGGRKRKAEMLQLKYSLKNTQTYKQQRLLGYLHFCLPEWGCAFSSQGLHNKEESIASVWWTYPLPKSISRSLGSPPFPSKLLLTETQLFSFLFAYYVCKCTCIFLCVCFVHISIYICLLM